MVLPARVQFPATAPLVLYNEYFREWPWPQDKQILLYFALPSPLAQSSAHLPATAHSNCKCRFVEWAVDSPARQESLFSGKRFCEVICFIAEVRTSLAFGSVQCSPPDHVPNEAVAASNARTGFPFPRRLTRHLVEMK